MEYHSSNNFGYPYILFYWVSLLSNRRTLFTQSSRSILVGVRKLTTYYNHAYKLQAYTQYTDTFKGKKKTKHKLEKHRESMTWTLLSFQELTQYSFSQWSFLFFVFLILLGFVCRIEGTSDNRINLHPQCGIVDENIRYHFSQFVVLCPCITIVVILASTLSSKRIFHVSCKELCLFNFISQQIYTLSGRIEVFIGEIHITHKPMLFVFMISEIIIRCL